MPFRFYLRLIQLSLLVQVVLTAGCQDSPTEPAVQTPRFPVASIRVEPEYPRVIIGQLTQLVAVPLDQSGAVVSGLTPHWSSERPDIVEVTASGQAMGHILGVANVTVRAGDRTHTTFVSVIEIPAVTVTLSVLDTTIVAGEEVSLTATVRDSLGRPLIDRPVTWHSENAAVATVSASGRVTAVSAGVAVIRARHEGMLAISGTMTVRVLEDLGGHLLMVSTDEAAGGPRIYRTDLRNTAQSIAPWQPTGLSAHPAVSPDGQRVAYTCAEPGTTARSAICVAQANGTNVQVLTAGDAFYEDEPTWSPDGTRIAFRRWAATFGWPGWTIPTDIWVMDASGGNLVNLTNDATSQHEPTWSPVPVDGSYRIAFLEEEILDGLRSTWVASMRTDGSDRRNETTGAPRFERSPTWFPDGSRILFSRGPVGGVGELYAVDVATGVSGRFLPYVLGGGQSSPAWSPTGAYLAFSSAHESAAGHDWQVYTVRADGTGLIRRTSGGAGRSQLVWVPNP
jgi:Tol biopolymer transport system component